MIDKTERLRIKPNLREALAILPIGKATLTVDVGKPVRFTVEYLLDKAILENVILWMNDPDDADSPRVQTGFDKLLGGNQ